MCSLTTSYGEIGEVSRFIHTRYCALRRRAWHGDTAFCLAFCKHVNLREMSQDTASVQNNAVYCGEYDETLYATRYLV